MTFEGFPNDTLNQLSVSIFVNDLDTVEGIMRVTSDTVPLFGTYYSLARRRLRLHLVIAGVERLYADRKLRMLVKNLVNEGGFPTAVCIKYTYGDHGTPHAKAKAKAYAHAKALAAAGAPAGIEILQMDMYSGEEVTEITFTAGAHGAPKSKAKTKAKAKAAASPPPQEEVTVNLGSDGSDDDDEGVTTGTPQPQQLPPNIMNWIAQNSDLPPAQQQAMAMEILAAMNDNDDDDTTGDDSETIWMQGWSPGTGVPQNAPTADVATPGAHGTPLQQP